VYQPLVRCTEQRQRSLLVTLHLVMSSRICDADAYNLNGFEGFSTDLGAPMPSLMGDFYCEPDDVVRGVTLPLGDGFGFSQACDIDKFSQFAHVEPFSIPSNEFQTSDVPPALPDELRPHLEATTLHLSEHSAVIAGNSLITFLEHVVHARIKKVNHKKFTIRADIIIEGFPCDIKVRIYQEQRASLLEFQRRSGDTVAFMRFYSQASGYLQGQHAAVDSWRQPEIPHMARLPPDEAIAPLIDMAEFHDVNLLSDAAAALAAMSDDPAIACQLRMPCAFSVMQHLQQVNDFSVAFPTSHMLCHA